MLVGLILVLLVFICRYMYAGAAHADSSEYQPCIALWNYALQLKIHKEATSCQTK